MAHPPEPPQLLSSSTVAHLPGGHMEGFAFSDVLRAIRNGKWLIVACTLLCVGISIVYVFLATPIYQASGLVRIDPTRSGSLGLTDVLIGAPSDVIPTEIGIFTSDQVALSSMEALTAAQFQSFAGFPKSAMVFRLEDAQQNPIYLNAQQMNVIEKFKKSLTAKQVEGTQLVGISFRDRDPQLAARILNHAVDAYLRAGFDSRYNSVAQVHDWLSTQMGQLQQRASAAQQKLAQFQEANNLVGTTPTDNTVVDRLKLLNERVTLAESDRIVKEAQLRAAMSGDPAVLTSLVTDPELTSLEATRGSLYAQYAQLATKYGANYPPLIETKRQLSEVQNQIENGVKVITSRLREDFTASQQAENMLRAQYEQEIARAQSLNRKQADYAVLVAEGTASRDLYDTLEYRLQQATVNAGLDSINTMIVDRARVPLLPVEPKKLLILASALVLGLAVGIGAALIKDAVGGEIQTISQIENGTGLATLATVPHIDWHVKGETVNAQSRLVTLREGRSRGADAYRTLRNSVLLSSIDRAPRLLLITSSLSGEGKTSTAANYSIVLAQRGAKVLIIDSDLRRPTMHVVLGVPNKLGLSDFLIDRASAEDIQTPIPELPNLHFISAGTNLTFPSESLASAKLQSLLQQWKEEYDNVILDSAPVLLVSDSLPIANMADTTILIARAGVTPFKALMRSRAILARARARIAGVLLNDTSSTGQGSGYYGKDGYDYYN
jgi:polysaccharide biosynthesis transport protein